MRRWWSGLVVAVCAVPLVLMAGAVAMARPRHDDEEARRAATRRELQRVLDEVRARLGIDRAVMLEVVAKNPLVVSVEAPAEQDAPYLVRLEEGLLTLLAPDELEAALAHELGHVWVFTHHPFLQTERLANDVAMRAVSREALARVYEKVWRQGGTKGDLVRFLGAAPAAMPEGPRPQP